MSLMPWARFEPAVPAIKRPQTYALRRTATGIGYWNVQRNIIKRIGWNGLWVAQLQLLAFWLSVFYSKKEISAGKIKNTIFLLLLDFRTVPFFPPNIVCTGGIGTISHVLQTAELQDPIPTATQNLHLAPTNNRADWFMVRTAIILLTFCAFFSVPLSKFQVMLSHDNVFLCLLPVIIDQSPCHSTLGL